MAARFFATSSHWVSAIKAAGSNVSLFAKLKSRNEAWERGVGEVAAIDAEPSNISSFCSRYLC